MSWSERRASVRAFDRSGMLQSKAFSRSVLYIGALGATAMALGISGLVASSGGLTPGDIVLSTALMSAGSLLLYFVVSGLIARRKSNKSLKSHSDRG